MGATVAEAGDSATVGAAATSAPAAVGCAGCARLRRERDGLAAELRAALGELGAARIEARVAEMLRQSGAIRPAPP